jgi:predicted membrane channel-forming protein YqfA (hemolysin III family)
MLRILLFILRINWFNYRPADCLPYACFCETVSTGLIRQPINAYTNIGYMLVGILILVYLKRSNALRLERSSKSDLPRRILMLFGIAYIMVGIGSFIYHASFIFLGEELDDDSMYMIGIFLVLFESARLRKLTIRQFLWIYIAMNFLFEAAIYFFPVIRGMLFAILIAISFVIEFFARKQEEAKDEVRLTDRANFLFLLAYLIWILDKTHILCYPNSLFQGHAIWHLLTAYAGWVMFKAMDCEYESAAIAE